MKRLMTLKKGYYSFDKKGMVLPAIHVKGCYLVRALDIVLYNHHIMSKSEIERCFIHGIEFDWRYLDKDLSILNND